MRASTTALLAAVALLPSSVYGWGSLGHQTIAYIAQDFVSSSTASWAQTTLGISNSSYLASVATWADDYRYTTAGKFSAPFHYIDALDSPPSSCGVSYDRDCGSGGCVVSAITNYTNRVGDNRFSSTNRKQALEFLVHFLGDITQPLHDESHETGGNGIAVTFDGKKTNLHHIWDTEIPEKYVGGYALADARRFATELTTAIKSGAYSSQRQDWLQGMDTSDAQSSSMIWAQDANAYVCSNCLKGGDSAVEGTDLGSTYYNDNIPVVKLQIAKAGYRLAAWLNLINDGTTGL